ncbi:Hsp20/alpha crystallin family protein [Ectobacillus polymachus]|uniref:Hsp20/alpha crystallin family protein n=1 Tax=Ectobacillus polymachus TaxID=1508806 RepID=UPI003A87E27E
MSEDKKSNDSRLQMKGYLKQIDEFFEQTPLRGLIEDMNHFFQKGNRLVTFPVDLYEVGNELIIEAEIPGIQKNQIKIEMEEEYIRISIKDELTTIEDQEVNSYYRRERSTSESSRILRLPYSINKKLSKATYENGILTIRAPKIPKQRNTLSIE